MLSSALKLLFALFAFSTFTAAQFGPDQRWTNPDGSFPDFTDSYRQGEVVTLSWTALNNSISDLWLTNFDVTSSNFNVSLARNVNISVAGSLQWKVDIDATVLSKSNKFNVRFFPAGAAYGILQFQQNISPGFVVNSTSGAGATTTVSSTASSSTTGSTGTASSTLRTSTGTTTGTSSTATTSILSSSPSSSSSSSPSSSSLSSSSSSSSSNSGGGLSVAAQAGIGVGVGVGVLGLLIIGCCVGRKYRVSRVSQRPPSYTTIPPTSNQPVKEMDSNAGAGWGFQSSTPSKPKFKEVQGDFAQPQELPAVENERRAIAELPGRLV